jgi:histidinol-phosphate phosphatase family protein
MAGIESKRFPDAPYRVTTRDGILSFHAPRIPAGMPQPSVFLDRDGVLNRRISGGYVTRWADFTFLPGVMETLSQLVVAGFQLVIVSNQAGVAKGLLSCEDLIQITEASLKELQAAGVPMDGAFFCLHQPADACPCRKPRVGLLEEAARVLPIDFRRSFLIGDSPSDMQAGAQMGCATIYLAGEAGASIPATNRAKTLSEAVGWVLARKS